jgi:hypothetical protein
MYASEYWPEEYETFEEEPGEYEDDSFEFEARWRGAGELEFFISNEPPMPLQSLPDFTLPVGIAAVIFLLFVFTRGGADPAAILPVIESAAVVGAAESAPAPAPLPDPDADPSAYADPSAFAAPYEDYVITQGVHGTSYGHMAIDLAAGQGAAILSPIHGVVTVNLKDRHGNPTLVIENDRYAVTMLHGIYSADVGEVVSLGQPVGEESNLGYTTDMRGVPCWQKEGYCGYHTHLNVFDKELDSNVNPLELIPP